MTEIVAANKEGKWLRYTVRAVFETDAKYAKVAFDVIPDLMNIYNETMGYKMMMFHLEDTTAVIIQMMGEGEKID